MIESLTPRIRALILDLDGVLWKDHLPLIDLPRFFTGLERRGLSVILATNNATRHPVDTVAKLDQFGAKIEPWQVVTSAMAVTYLLKKRFPDGGPIYIVGEIGLLTSLQEGGFYPADENVLAVVAGLDRKLTYEKLRRATLLIRSGVPFYGTNADTSFPTPAGLVPGAGAVLAALETASGVSPILAGKPQPIMYNMALETLNISPLETLAIGDRLDTDILGGQRAGCRTALVLSGVTTPSELKSWSPPPDLVADDVSQLIYDE